jgi:hypothetical protein
MYKCLKCEKSFEKYSSLSKHVSRQHKIVFDQFYVDYNLNGVWPTCKCGCGQKLKWSRQLKGFRSYSAGHQSRIKNNWGHNATAIAKSSETRRRQFNSGERQVWNIGLTKETDNRLRMLGIVVSDSFTDSRKEKMSMMMRRNRLDGTTPTLYGPKSSRWKGGISEVNNIARSDKRMYDEWKYPILVRDGFKCVKCGNKNDKLHVHHDKEKMCDIVKKHIVDDIIMDFDLKKCIADKIVDYHIKNKVSGITLCGKCHEKYHPSLNFD